MGNSDCPLCRTPVPVTGEEELALLQRNVENGIPAAMFQLGSNYANGLHGLVPSHKKAARLYQRAADLGDVLAMHNLGFLYERGEGIKLDLKKTVKYWRMAAEQGMASAQYNLGTSYERGEGVAQDYAEAARLYKLAADQGHTKAEYNLGVMYYCGNGFARDIAEGIFWLKRAAAKGNKRAKDALTEIEALRPRAPPRRHG